jgi:hypothetical protein
MHLFHHLVSISMHMPNGKPELGSSWIDLSVDGQVLILRVVDLDIGLVAHINSGSYRGEAETHQKGKAFNTWHRCANNNDDMTSSWY